MLKIREIAQEDNPEIKTIITSIMRDEFQESARAYSIDDVEDACSHYCGKNEVFYVAENDGHIIGTVGIKNDAPHTALLRRLFLKKEYRGKGYGAKLVHEALEFCRKHGYKKVIFRGTDAMRAAFKTCLKNGFKEKDILVLPHVKMFILELSI
jgi:GNAT superfamily N-acetyltransferase